MVTSELYHDEDILHCTIWWQDHVNVIQHMKGAILEHYIE